VIGDPNLKPESSDSVQLGGTFDFGPAVKVDANLFYNRVKDLIQIDQDNGVPVNGITEYRYENVGRARTQGLETAVRWQATPSLTLQAAYTRTDTEDLETGLELTRRPKDIARIGLDWTAAPGTLVSVRGRYQSSELVNTATQGRSPAFGTVDATVNQQFGHGLTGFLGVSNLFDRQRDFADANDFGPLSGRLIYLGVTYAFGKTTP
jgi:outer membrane receptor for ferrienterochelin and colicins